MICRLCENDTVELLIDFGEQPIVHNLLKTCDEKYSKYPFRLGHCATCGFMQIMECIDPNILYQNYFTISSWKNQPHIPRLISVMQSITGLSGNSRILDIGCNDGSFLETLKQQGYENISGIEPTKDASQKALDKGLNVHYGFFGKETATNIFNKNYFDVITTRQVLEHISNLDDFLEGVNFVLKDDGYFVIEIPDSEWNLDYLDYALWEEHVNYFTLATLKQLLRKHSFEVIHHESTLFSGKALIVFCERVKTAKEKIEYNDSDRKKTRNYQSHWELYKNKLYKFLASQNKPIAVYGCGARSSTFVNFTAISKFIDCFIDDQTEKQDLFVPGGLLRINPWHNSKYEDYIFLLGVNTENEYKVIHNRKLQKENYYSVLPPSRHLIDFWKSMIYD